MGQYLETRRSCSLGSTWSRSSTWLSQGFHNARWNTNYVPTTNGVDMSSCRVDNGGHVGYLHELWWRGWSILGPNLGWVEPERDLLRNTSSTLHVWGEWWTHHHCSNLGVPALDGFCKSAWCTHVHVGVTGASLYHSHGFSKYWPTAPIQQVANIPSPGIARKPSWDCHH